MSETADQIVEWIAGLSDSELPDALTRHELPVGGTRADKYRRLKRQLLLYRGLSDRSSVSELDRLLLLRLRLAKSFLVFRPRQWRVH